MLIRPSPARLSDLERALSQAASGPRSAASEVDSYPRPGDSLPPPNEAFMKADSFGARATFETGSGPAGLYRLAVLEKAGLAPSLARLPFSIRVLLEAVLRNVDGELVSEDDVKRLAGWN